MRPPYRHKFTLLFVLCCIIYSTESRYKDTRRKSDKLSASSSSSSSLTTYGGSSSGSTALASQVEQTSLCHRRRDMKLICYCTPDESYVPVTKAECWILQSGLLQNDTTWQRFYQQKKLRQLKFVVQNTGHLDYIPTKYFEPLSNLTSVTIEYSQIQVVKSYAFASLPNLEVITLTNNQIEVLDKDAIANHIYLRELFLQHNQITEIDRFAFRNLPVLMRLFLNRNNITTLHEEVFSELGKLEELNLEYNSISVLTSDMFKGLGNLKLLKLTYNNLNFIGDTVFAELWSLQELQLDDNHIERISERALDGLNNLKTLNLRNNVLKKLDNGLLRGTPALLSINLQDNLLETLTFYNFQPIMDNLVNSTSELLLSDNKFICDCRLQWIFELRNRTRNLQLKETLEDIVCLLRKDQKSTASNFVKPILDNEVGGVAPIANAGAAGTIGTTGQTKRTRARGQSNRQRQNDKKRQNQNQKFAMGIDLAGVATKLETNDEAENYPDKSTRNRANKQGTRKTGSGAAEYYEDDATLFGHSVEFEDDVDLLKQQTLYVQHGGAGDVGSGVTTSKELLDAADSGAAVEVELFSLRIADLPCPGELSDPTELPLSRESIGMDVRSPQANAGAVKLGWAMAQIGSIWSVVILTTGILHRHAWTVLSV